MYDVLILQCHLSVSEARVPAHYSLQCRPSLFLKQSEYAGLQTVSTWYRELKEISLKNLKLVCESISISQGTSLLSGVC